MLGIFNQTTNTTAFFTTVNGTIQFLGASLTVVYHSSPVSYSVEQLTYGDETTPVRFSLNFDYTPVNCSQLMAAGDTNPAHYVQFSGTGELIMQPKGGVPTVFNATGFYNKCNTSLTLKVSPGNGKVLQLDDLKITNISAVASSVAQAVNASKSSKRNEQIAQAKDKLAKLNGVLSGSVELTSSLGGSITILFDTKTKALQSIAIQVTYNDDVATANANILYVQGPCRADVSRATGAGLLTLHGVTDDVMNLNISFKFYGNCSASGLV